MKKILVLPVILVLAIMIHGDTLYHNSSIAFGGSFSLNLYSPSDHIKDGYSTVTLGSTSHDVTDNGKYGGVGVNLWFLFRLGKSPLKMGVAISGDGYRTESNECSHLVWSDTGAWVETSSTLVGFNFRWITDFFLLSLDRTFLHFELGAGLMFFDERGYKPPFEPTVDFITTGRLIWSIPFGKQYSIDPQIGILKGFNENRVFAFQITVGVSAWY